jgi:hypothetical protein
MATYPGRFFSGPCQLPFPENWYYRLFAVLAKSKLHPIPVNYAATLGFLRSLKNQDRRRRGPQFLINHTVNLTESRSGILLVLILSNHLTFIWGNTIL